MISTKLHNVIQVFTQLRLKETFQTVPVESSRMFQNSDSLISEILHASDTTGAVITEGRHTAKHVGLFQIKLIMTHSYSPKSYLIISYHIFHS